MQWIYGQGVTDFRAMTNLGKELRHCMSAANRFVIA